MPEEKNLKKEKPKKEKPNKVKPEKEAVASEAIPSELTNLKSIVVDVRNRKEQFFKGEAKTVSSVNDTGEFDVLSKHANFVTLIRGYLIIDKGLPSEKKIDIDSGVLAAKTDAVDVYLDF